MKSPAKRVGASWEHSRADLLPYLLDQVPKVRDRLDGPDHAGASVLVELDLVCGTLFEFVSPSTTVRSPCSPTLLGRTRGRCVPSPATSAKRPDSCLR
jgi:hypothetical protein